MQNTALSEVERLQGTQSCSVAMLLALVFTPQQTDILNDREFDDRILQNLCQLPIGDRRVSDFQVASRNQKHHLATREEIPSRKAS